MDGNELQEWHAYYSLEPWGEERMDLRFGQLTAFLYNSLRGTGQPPLSAADFLPNFLDDPADTAPRDEERSTEAAFAALTAMSGGVLVDAEMGDAEIERYILANSTADGGEAGHSDGFDEMEG